MSKNIFKAIAFVKEQNNKKKNTLTPLPPTSLLTRSDNPLDKQHSALPQIKEESTIDPKLLKKSQTEYNLRNVAKHDPTFDNGMNAYIAAEALKTYKEELIKTSGNGGKSKKTRKSSNKKSKKNKNKNNKKTRRMRKNHSIKRRK
jgi:hypothetical protein